jgi:transcriptional regulator with XRE-family HTH domain
MNPESLHKRIGLFIAARRNSLDMKQEQLAASVGISRASVANIERGRQSVLVHHLYAIAKALGLQPSELLPQIDDVETDEALPLPSGLKPEQMRAVSRMFAARPSENAKTPIKEGYRVKSKKA